MPNSIAINMKLLYRCESNDKLKDIIDEELT